MNALKLYHDLKKRGVVLATDGETLKVNAPTEALTEEDRAALAEYKLLLLKLAATKERREEPEDDGRRFVARPSRYPGYTSLYDPIEGRWHDFPSKDCLPSIAAEASGRRKRGGAA